MRNGTQEQGMEARGSKVELMGAMMGNWLEKEFEEPLGEMLRPMIEVLFQRLLDAEVTEALGGRKKSERIASVESAPRGYRNGYGKPRKLTTMAGTITIRRPRVRGMDDPFVSRVLPLFQRRTTDVDKLMVNMYLHGLAQGDFELALRGLLGDGAPLSKSTLQRLRGRWEADMEKWGGRSLAGQRVVYVWVDGVYVKAGLEKDKAAVLVAIGAMADGTKKLLAVQAGYRESRESWSALLRDLGARGLNEPEAVIGDGHLGIWAAVRDVWPNAKEQRCWNHKMINVLDQLPKRVQSEAKQQLRRVVYAKTRREAEQEREKFVELYEEEFPQAAAVLGDDWERMTTFFDFPEQHWRHLRTTNVVESPFAAVRLRTNAAKRYKRVDAATAMIWKLLMVAEQRFRRLNAPHLVELVARGVRFEDGKPAPAMRLAA